MIISNRSIFCLKALFSLSFFVPFLLYLINDHFAWENLTGGKIPWIISIYLIAVSFVLYFSAAILLRWQPSLVGSAVLSILAYWSLSYEYFEDTQNLLLMPLAAIYGGDILNLDFISLKLSALQLSVLFSSLAIFLVNLFGFLSNIKGWWRGAGLALLCIAMEIFFLVNIALAPQGQLQDYFAISHVIMWLVLIIAIIFMRTKFGVHFFYNK